MPIVNAAEDGGMRSIDHLMKYIGFRYDQTGITHEFPNEPDDRQMKEFQVREIFFKGFPGAWITADGTKVRQGNDTTPMSAATYDKRTLSLMSIRGLKVVAKEIGAPIVADFDQQIEAIVNQQKLNDIGIIIPGVTTKLAANHPMDREESEEGEEGEGGEEEEEEETSTDPALQAGTSDDVHTTPTKGKGGKGGKGKTSKTN